MKPASLDAGAGRGRPLAVQTHPKPSAQITAATPARATRLRLSPCDSQVHSAVASVPASHLAPALWPDAALPTSLDPSHYPYSACRRHSITRDHCRQMHQAERGVQKRRDRVASETRCTATPVRWSDSLVTPHCTRIMSTLPSATLSSGSPPHPARSQRQQL